MPQEPVTKRDLTS